MRSSLLGKLAQARHRDVEQDDGLVEVPLLHEANRLDHLLVGEPVLTEGSKRNRADETQQGEKSPRHDTPPSMRSPDGWYARDAPS